MIVLFGVAFMAAIALVIFFLIELPNDLKKQSLRPLFILFLAIGLWVATLPTLLSPENTLSSSYPAYNIIEFGGTIQIPAYAVNTVSTLSVRTYNSYFYVWIGILVFLLFLLLFWWLMLLRSRAKQLLEGGKDMMEEFNKNWGKNE